MSTHVGGPLRLFLPTGPDATWRETVFLEPGKNEWNRIVPTGRLLLVNRPRWEDGRTVDNLKLRGGEGEVSWARKLASRDRGPDGWLVEVPAGPLRISPYGSPRTELGAVEVLPGEETVFRFP